MEHIIFILIGVVGGLFAGTFGLGGGVIFIPTVLFVLEGEGVENLYQIAVATSLTGIIFTGIGSAYGHYRLNNYDMLILKRILPSIVIASFIAAFVILRIPSSLLKDFYAVFVVFIGLKMLFSLFEPSEPHSSEKLKKREASLPLAGVLIGFASVMLGIGGGSMSVPLLSQYYGVDIKKSIAVSSVIGVFIAIFATVGFLMNVGGFGNNRDDIRGFFYLPAITMIVAATLTAPFGATVCKKLNRNLLKKLFGLILLLVGSKILFL